MDHTIIYNPRSLDAVLATSAFMASAPPDVSRTTLVPFDQAARAPAADYITVIDAPWAMFQIGALPGRAAARQVTVYSNRPACIASWLGPSYVGSHESHQLTMENVQFHGLAGPLYRHWHKPDTCPAFEAALTETGDLSAEFTAWARSLPLHAGYLPRLWEDLQSMTAIELSQLLLTTGSTLLRAEDAAIEYAVQHCSSRLCLSPRNGWSRANGRAVAASPLALERTAQAGLILSPESEVYVAYCVYGRQVYGVMAVRSSETLNHLPVHRLARGLGEFSVSVEQFFTHWAA
jgi:hypothetical protein